jgi:hypothetical protein
LNREEINSYELQNKPSTREITAKQDSKSWRKPLKKKFANVNLNRR